MFTNNHPRSPIASHYQLMTDTEKDYICSLDKDNGMHKCDNLPPFRYGGRECYGEAIAFSSNIPNETWCVNWNRYYTKCGHGKDNPFQGAMSFDNVGMAWTAIFLVISLEGWSEIMYYVQDAHSFWDWVYFVLLIVVSIYPHPHTFADDAARGSITVCEINLVASLNVPFLSLFN